MKWLLPLSVCSLAFMSAQSHALEAVALPSDGAGSASGASTYALANQLTSQNAALAAQGGLLQQLNQSVSSLTTVINNLTTQITQISNTQNQIINYLTQNTCKDGKITTVDGALTCTGASAAPSTGCPGYYINNNQSMPMPGTYNGQWGAYNTNVTFGQGYIIPFRASNSPDGTYQCMNGSWVKIQNAPVDNNGVGW
ncbi:MAG: hypothetical protein GC129_03835 [Proteobacteria bacterium]|nr:hypothetical protein [Pseudomonadota bacterium]